MTSTKHTEVFDGLGAIASNEHFQNHIDGIYGTFSTPSGVVCYLQTKAKLGSDGFRGTFNLQRLWFQHERH